MSLVSRYALRSYPFNFSNQLPDIANKKWVNTEEGYIYKLVGISALKGAKNLYIRSGHFHNQIFDHLADALQKVENIKDSIWKNLEIKISLIISKEECQSAVLAKRKTTQKYLDFLPFFAYILAISKMP